MDTRKAWGWAALLAVMLSACSGGGEAAGDGGQAGGESVAGGIDGPFPKTVTGTVGYSFPLEDDSGDIELGLLEFDHAEILVSDAVYAAKGMDEEDAEVTLSLTPLPKARCGDEAVQCFRGE
jgi:hypothetical protein